MMRIRPLFFLVLSVLPALHGATPVTLNDDGAWSWFEDERALVQQNTLIVGSVANGRHDPARRGDIDVTVHDLLSGQTHRVTLHKNLQADDHDSPALLVRPDGRLLALYSKHGSENRIYYRITRDPYDATVWNEEKVFIPSQPSRVTYANLHFLAEENGGGGRVYNFFRGLDGTFKPSWMFSDDYGASWQVGGVLIDVRSKFKHRPYVKYASNGKDTIHFAFTEGHPRDYDNSIYHAFYRQGKIHRSDGGVIGTLGQDPIQPSQATRVFHGNAKNVAWIHDLQLDPEGHPRLVYSVQKDSGGLAPGKGGEDHRYHWARWNGRAWQDVEVAYAGKRLYAGEDDYTGGICLDPDRADRIYISTSVQPATGQPLLGGHYELFQGTTPDGGRTWLWKSWTPGAVQDHLRPILPPRVQGKTALLWLRGSYTRYTSYALEVVSQNLTE